MWEGYMLFPQLEETLQASREALNPLALDFTGEYLSHLLDEEGASFLALPR
jgi:hypothetical protein